MSSAKVAVTLNDEAIQYLQKGNYRAAIWSFDMAVGRLRAWLSEKRQERNRLSHRNFPRSNKSDNVSACMEEILLRYLDSKNNEKIICSIDQERDTSAHIHCVPILKDGDLIDAVSQNVENIFEFYPRAFVMDKSVDIDDKSWRYLALLMYNMAVAYHYDGILSGRSARFNRALELYEMGLSVMHLAMNQDEAEDILLQLALSNNMGHVHSHLLHFQETRESLNSVRDLMKASKICDSPLLSEDDYIFFFTTVVVFDGQEFAVAPAA